MHKPTIDVDWSFQSPYSYLATPDMKKLKADDAVEMRFRPVSPIAVRSPDFFNPDNLKRGRYIIQDWPRQARAGLDLAAMEAAIEEGGQPYFGQDRIATLRWQLNEAGLQTEA